MITLKLARSSCMIFVMNNFIFYDITGILIAILYVYVGIGLLHISCYARIKY